MGIISLVSSSGILKTFGEVLEYKYPNDTISTTRVILPFTLRLWFCLSGKNTSVFLPVLFTSSKSSKGIKWSDTIIYCYLDLDLVIDLISFLSSSSFLSSEDFVSWRFSSPSSSDLISELPEDTLCPCSPVGMPVEKYVKFLLPMLMEKFECICTCVS